jgi:hypothetical protein
MPSVPCLCFPGRAGRWHRTHPLPQRTTGRSNVPRGERFRFSGASGRVPINSAFERCDSIAVLNRASRVTVVELPASASCRSLWQAGEMMLSLIPQRVRPSEHGAEQVFGADPCAALGRAIPARRAMARLERGTSLAQVISSDVSDASANWTKRDGLYASGRIWHGRTKLRALWTVWSVVVRVHSGAWKSLVYRDFR